MYIFGKEDEQFLFEQSRSCARGRMNLNVHPELSDPVQRLFNAMQPGSYVQPHRHMGPDAWEAFVLVQGEGVALTFDEEGHVTYRAHLSMDGARMVEIPTSTFHTVFARKENTLFFEIKKGPYNPNKAKDFAHWAPQENEVGVQQYIHWLQTADVGMRYSK
jgi:cupin fold WbuC family metalloprotein